MGPCCFQIVSTHFNARPNRREIRNVIFVEKTHWECSQVAGEMQEAFHFFSPEDPANIICYDQFNEVFIHSYYLKASHLKYGRQILQVLDSTLSTLSSVCGICLYGVVLGDKDPCASIAAWRVKLCQVLINLHRPKCGVSSEMRSKYKNLQKIQTCKDTRRLRKVCQNTRQTDLA